MKKQFVFIATIAFLSLISCQTIPKTEPKNIAVMYQKQSEVIVELSTQTFKDSLQSMEDLILFAPVDSLNVLMEKLKVIESDYIHGPVTTTTLRGGDYTLFYRPIFDGIAKTNWQGHLRFDDEILAENLPQMFLLFSVDAEVYYDHEVEANQTLKDRYNQIDTIQTISIPQNFNPKKL